MRGRQARMLVAIPSPARVVTAAWGSLMPGLAADDVVGLKINAVAVHLVPHQAVIEAIVTSLTGMICALKNF